MLERQVEPPETQRVGDMLRQHRVRSGFDLAEVSGYLHIRRGYLEAIEQGRYDLLPGPAYAAGFVRAYAGFLGCDADATVDRLQHESATLAAVVPLHSRAPVAEGNAPRAGVVLMGAAIAFLAYAGWYLSTARSPDVAHLTVAVSHEGQSADQLPAAPPQVRELASAAPAMPASVPVQAGATGAAPTASIVPPQPPAAAPAPPALAAPAATTALAAEPPDGGLAAPAEAPSRIVLRAKTDSWVEVRDTESNSLLIGRLLRSGEAFAVPDRPGLRLITGNAGGLAVFVDGEAVPPLGKEGAVRRGVGLDPDALRRLAASGLTQ